MCRTTLFLVLLVSACGGGSELPEVDDVDSGSEEMVGLNPRLFAGRGGDTVSLDDDGGPDGGMLDVDSGTDAGEQPAEAGSGGAGGAAGSEPQAGTSGEGGAGSGEAGSSGSGEAGAGMAGSAAPFMPEHSMFVGDWDYVFVSFSGSECPGSVDEMKARAEDATYANACPNPIYCTGTFSFDGAYAVSDFPSPQLAFDHWDEQDWVGDYMVVAFGPTLASFQMTAMFWLASEDEMFGFEMPDAAGAAAGYQICHLYHATKK